VTIKCSNKHKDMGILCSKSIQEWLYWIQTEEKILLTTNLTKWELGGNQVTAEMLINHSPPHCAPIVSWWCQTKKLGANYRVDAISSYYQRGLDTNKFITPFEVYSCLLFILQTYAQQPLVRNWWRLSTHNMKVKSKIRP
jgi:hypothetical protein